MGQHVYIELDAGQGETESAWKLPEYYLITEGERHYVYAAAKDNRIEKRQVTLGAYDADLGAYEVIDGLTLTDRIAFPDDTVSPGMTAADAGYAETGGGEGADGGASMDGMDMAMPEPVN